jgi:hypothetical protein
VDSSHLWPEIAESIAADWQNPMPSSTGIHQVAAFSEEGVRPFGPNVHCFLCASLQYLFSRKCSNFEVILIILKCAANFIIRKPWEHLLWLSNASPTGEAASHIPCDPLTFERQRNVRRGIAMKMKWKRKN